MACVLSLACFPAPTRPSKHERVYASSPSPFHININGPSSDYLPKKLRANNRLNMTIFLSITSVPQQFMRMRLLPRNAAGNFSSKVQTAQVARAMAAGACPPEPELCNEMVRLMKDYCYLGGKPFFGTESAIEAQDWLDTCERIFDDLKIMTEENTKSKLAIRELRGRAMRWWNDNNTLDAEISWDKFKEKFVEKYITEVQKSVLFRKFVDLRQGGMSVSEYVTEFEMLSKYGKSLIDPPTKKIEKFVIGLDDPLREMLLNHIGAGEIATYDILVQKALRHESLYSKPKPVLASTEEPKPQVSGGGKETRNNNNNNRKQLQVRAG